MDKELSHHDQHNSGYSSSPAAPPIRKLVQTAAAVSGGDRLKRDEWSEGAVSNLLEAYEAKWVLRNRAKLKGQDWEDVAKHVSSRANSGKSPKTQTQCKNKIESMKKRYRSESVAVDGSSWPLFPRLDHLLRGNATTAVPAPILTSAIPLRLVELPSPPPILTPVIVSATQPSPIASNGIDTAAPKDQDDDRVTVMPNYDSDKIPMVGIDTDSSTPALYSNGGDKGTENPAKRQETDRRHNRRKRTSEEDKKEKIDGGRRNGNKPKWEVAKSIKWLAEAVVRAEESRTTAMREIERMRAEADTKRAELELKRTEIIANTQLEIARIFAAAGKDRT